MAPAVIRRYSESPPSRGNRLAGIAGTVALLLLVPTLLLATWRNAPHIAPGKQTSLITHEFAASPAREERDERPAAPQRKSDAPAPGPRSTQAPPVQLVALPPELPSFQLPVTFLRQPMAVAPMASHDARGRSRAPKNAPAVPVSQSARTESADAAPGPAMAADSGRSEWEAELHAAINREKRYPRGAARNREEGRPIIRVVMNRRGRVLDVTLARSGGSHSLDREALVLPDRAEPLPRPPIPCAGTQSPCWCRWNSPCTDQ